MESNFVTVNPCAKKRDDVDDDDVDDDCSSGFDFVEDVTRYTVEASAAAKEYKAALAAFDLEAAAFDKSIEAESEEEEKLLKSRYYRLWRAIDKGPSLVRQSVTSKLKSTRRLFDKVGAGTADELFARQFAQNIDEENVKLAMKQTAFVLLRNCDPREMLLGGLGVKRLEQVVLLVAGHFSGDLPLMRRYFNELAFFAACLFDLAEENADARLDDIGNTRFTHDMMMRVALRRRISGHHSGEFIFSFPPGKDFNKAIDEMLARKAEDKGSDEEEKKERVITKVAELTFLWDTEIGESAFTGLPRTNEEEEAVAAPETVLLE